MTVANRQILEEFHAYLLNHGCQNGARLLVQSQDELLAFDTEKLAQKINTFKIDFETHIKTQINQRQQRIQRGR